MAKIKLPKKPHCTVIFSTQLRRKRSPYLDQKWALIETVHKLFCHFSNRKTNWTQLWKTSSVSQRFKSEISKEELGTKTLISRDRKSRKNGAARKVFEIVLPSKPIKEVRHGIWLEVHSARDARFPFFPSKRNCLSRRQEDSLQKSQEWLRGGTSWWESLRGI